MYGFHSYSFGPRAALLFVPLMLALAIISSGCDATTEQPPADGGRDGRFTDGNPADGNPTDGNAADGNATDGNGADGGVLPGRLWPLAVGNQWFYDANVSTTQYEAIWTILRKVAASEIVPTLSGELWEVKLETTRASSPGPAYLYWQDTGSRIVLHHEIAGDGSRKSYSPPATVTDEAWRQMAAGTTYTETFQATKVDADGQNEVSVDVERTFTVFGSESITVPAGSFDAVHISYQDNTTEVVDLLVRGLWFVPGTGRVRITLYGDGGSVAAGASLSSYVLH